MSDAHIRNIQLAARLEEVCAENERLRAQVAALSAPAPAPTIGYVNPAPHAAAPLVTSQVAYLNLTNGTAAPAPAPAEPVAWHPMIGKCQACGHEHEIPRTTCAAPAAPAAIDVERLIADCLPGGSVCDPQQVADAIRTYFNAWDAAPGAPQGDKP